jgi:hypothetical protein
MTPTQAQFFGITMADETPLHEIYNNALKLSDELYGIAMERLGPLNQAILVEQDVIERIIQADGDIDKAIADAEAEIQGSRKKTSWFAEDSITPLKEYKRKLTQNDGSVERI